MRLIVRAATVLAFGSSLVAQLRQPELQAKPEGANQLLMKVGNYYPLKAIIEYLDYFYSWNVSFEDPFYLESQLVDISVPAWKKAHPGERGYYVPPWIELQVRISKPSGRPGERRLILDQLIQQYNALDRSDKYALHIYSETRQTVVGSVQGRQVWNTAKFLPFNEEIDGGTYLKMIQDQCGAQTPLHIVIGTVPYNALAHARMRAQQRAIGCRDALNTLTDRVAPDLVYQLMEDVSDQMYFISILPNTSYEPTSPLK